VKNKSLTGARGGTSDRHLAINFIHKIQSLEKYFKKKQITPPH
jgi:hypothetical protein